MGKLWLGKDKGEANFASEIVPKFFGYFQVDT
jgi:hypothetical protein